MQNLYEACYYGGMILGTLFLILTIVLFFVLKIPRVIGELTGSTARKGVKNLKEKGVKKDEGEQSKHYSQRSGAIKTRVTEGPSEELAGQNTTGRLGKTKTPKRRPSTGGDGDTEFLGESRITAAVTGDVAETAVLSASEGKEDRKMEFAEMENLREKRNAPSDVADMDTDEEETAVLSTEEPKTEEASEKYGRDKTFETQPDETAPQGGIGDDEATEVLSSGGEADISDGDDEATEILSSEADDEATEVLSSEADDEATEILSSEADDEATEVLSSEADDEATEVLSSDTDYEATDVLTGYGDVGETSVLMVETTCNSNKKYTVLYNVVEIHTKEGL